MPMDSQQRQYTHSVNPDQLAIDIEAPPEKSKSVDRRNDSWNSQNSSLHERSSRMPPKSDAELGAVILDTVCILLAATKFIIQHRVPKKDYNPSTPKSLLDHLPMLTCRIHDKTTSSKQSQLALASMSAVLRQDGISRSPTRKRNRMWRFHQKLFVLHRFGRPQDRVLDHQDGECMFSNDNESPIILRLWYRQ